MVKIYLCPDKCSGGLRSNYSLLPDILLDAAPVYTTVNHRLPITFLHKTRPVFKSQGRGQLKICPGCARVFLCVTEVGPRGRRNLFHHLMLIPFFLFFSFFCKTTAAAVLTFPRHQKLAAQMFLLAFPRQKSQKFPLYSIQNRTKE